MHARNNTFWKKNFPEITSSPERARECVRASVRDPGTSKDKRAFVRRVAVAE